jgi:hypothetical protein
MAFERFHPDPQIQQNLDKACALRAAYLRELLSRLGDPGKLWLWARGPNTAPATDGLEHVSRQSLSQPERALQPQPAARG